MVSWGGENRDGEAGSEGSWTDQRALEDAPSLTTLFPVQKPSHGSLPFQSLPRFYIPFIHCAPGLAAGDGSKTNKPAQEAIGRPIGAGEENCKREGEIRDKR